MGFPRSQLAVLFVTYCGFPAPLLPLLPTSSPSPAFPAGMCMTTLVESTPQ